MQLNQVDQLAKSGNRSLSDVLKNAEKIELSASDIERATNGKCKVVVYHTLGNYTDILDLFKKTGTQFIALLYEVSENNGHWVTLILRDNKVPGRAPFNLEVFDSYGFGQLDYELRYAVYDKTPYLKRLVSISKAKNQIDSVDVSHYPMQKHLGDVNTCGRYVIVRVRFGNMSNKEFEHFIAHERLPPDQYVTLLTLHVHQQ